MLTNRLQSDILINVDNTSTKNKTKEVIQLNGINLALLEEKIKKSGMKRIAIAEKMHLTTAGLANKLKGKRDFNATEIKGIAAAINLTGEDILNIFFADNVGNTTTK